MTARILYLSGYISAKTISAWDGLYLALRCAMAVKGFLVGFII